MKIFYNFYNKADWAYVEAGTDGEKYPDRSATYPEDANIAVTVVAWKKSISAVSNIKEAQNTIYSNNQMLTIENVQSNVQIFDISGRVMQSAIVSGTFVSNKLNKGLYIVKIDGATKKVSVK